MQASLFNGANNSGVAGGAPGLIGFPPTPQQTHQSSPNYQHHQHHHINSNGTTNLVDTFTNLTINSINGGAAISNPSKVINYTIIRILQLQKLRFNLGLLK